MQLGLIALTKFQPIHKIKILLKILPPVKCPHFSPFDTALKNFRIRKKKWCIGIHLAKNKWLLQTHLARRCKRVTGKSNLPKGFQCTYHTIFHMTTQKRKTTSSVSANFIWCTYNIICGVKFKIVDFLLDQLKSGKGKICSWKQRPCAVFLFSH